MLDIVIVNFRTPALTVDCLRSLEPEICAAGATRVWVVENASADDSAEKISEAITSNGWNQWAKLTICERNLGFAGGNNVAIREALQASPGSEFIWLLNPDTIVHAGALKALVDFLRQHPRVGIAGSRLEHRDGKVQFSAFRFPSWQSELENSMRARISSRLLDRWVTTPPPRDEAHETNWLSGASMMVRREVFDQVGLLDDEYFMYFEELDFCLQAHRAGWACWYVPASRVVHLMGQSTGAMDGTRRRKPKYWFQARRRFFLKNYGRIQTFMADLAWASGYAVYRAGVILRGRKPYDPVWLWWDFVRYNFGFRGSTRRGP